MFVGLGDCVFVKIGVVVVVLVVVGNSVVVVEKPEVVAEGNYRLDFSYDRTGCTCLYNTVFFLCCFCNFCLFHGLVNSVKTGYLDLHCVVLKYS